MNLITKSMLIKGVAKEWRAQYPKGRAQDKDAIYNKLCRLPEGATENDIAKVIGNSSWTSNKCDECKQESDVVIMLGDEPDYKSNTASICPQCLSKAMSLVSSGKA